MNTTLLDRLRQDLPGQWQSGDASSQAWHADPIRTVYLTIGERRLFVSVCHGGIGGGIVGEAAKGVHSAKWKTIHRSICKGVARLALDHARQGKPIPTVPPWARSSLRWGSLDRLRVLTEREAKIRQDLAVVEAERAWLTSLSESNP